MSAYLLVSLSDFIYHSSCNFMLETAIAGSALEVHIKKLCGKFNVPTMSGEQEQENRNTEYGTRKSRCV